MPETFDTDEFDNVLREVDATRSASKNTDAPGEPRNTPAEAVDRRPAPPPRPRHEVVLRRVLVGVLILVGLMGYTASRGVSGWAALAGVLIGTLGVATVLSGVMFAGYAKKENLGNLIRYSGRRHVTGLPASLQGVAWLATPALVAFMPPDRPRVGSDFVNSEGAAFTAFFSATLLYALLIALFRTPPSRVF